MIVLTLQRLFFPWMDGPANQRDCMAAPLLTAINSLYMISIYICVLLSASSLAFPPSASSIYWYLRK